MWPRARGRWIREQGLLDPAKLVFLDETAAVLGVTAPPRVGAYAFAR